MSKEPKKPIKIDWKAEPSDESARQIWCAILLRNLHDATLTEKEIKDFGASAKVWKDQARAWLFTEEPAIAMYRNYIIESGCGLGNGRKAVEYLRDLVDSGVSFIELKKELGFR